MLSAADIIRLALFGALCLQAIHALWLSMMDRKRRANLWVATWCAAGAVILVGRHIQAHATVIDTVDLAMRLQLIAASLLIPISIGSTQWLADRPPRTWALLVLSGMALVFAGLTAFTDLVITPIESAPLVNGKLAVAGSLLPVLTGVLLVTGLYCGELLRRFAFVGDPASRYVMVAAVGFLVVAIVNDTMRAEGLSTVRLREFALGGIALALSFAISRRGAKELAGSRHSAAVRAETIGVLTRAQEQERRSLAHQLHQSTSQSLTTLVLRLQAIDTDASAQEIAEEVGELRTLAKATAEEVRGLARGLRPVLVDDLGLQVVLERFAAELAAEHAIDCDVQVYGVDSSLPEWLGIVLFRTAQDVISTIRRRGRGGTLSVVVDRSETGVRLIVEQDSVLADSVRDFEILYERAQLYGGDVTVESSESLGTSIYVDFPLHTEAPPP